MGYTKKERGRIGQRPTLYRQHGTLACAEGGIFAFSVEILPSPRITLTRGSESTTVELGEPVVVCGVTIIPRIEDSGRVAFGEVVD